jgi:ATP-dependent DNA helicase 2 subunit 2
LTANNEDEDKKRKRVYWRDIIQREELKALEEAKQVEEEAHAARMKLEAKGDGFEFKDEEVKEISSVNPIEDFNKMISDRKVDRVADAITQLQSLIERFVKSSLKGDLYGKAVECLRALREACIKEDEGAQFNKFMEKLKHLFIQGSNKEFW